MSPSSSNAFLDIFLPLQSDVPDLSFFVPLPRQPPQSSPPPLRLPALPPEIISAICTHLILPDLKSFRLSSSIHAQIAARYLTPTITLSPIQSSLDRLTAIASHPEIRLGVRTLAFDSSTYASHGRDHYQYMHVILQRCPQCSTYLPRGSHVYCEGHESGWLDEHWAIFSREHYKQTALLFEEKVKECLVSALPQFPGLRKVEYGTVQGLWEGGENVPVPPVPLSKVTMGRADLVLYAGFFQLFEALQGTIAGQITELNVDVEVQLFADEWFVRRGGAANPLYLPGVRKFRLGLEYAGEDFIHGRTWPRYERLISLAIDALNNDAALSPTFSSLVKLESLELEVYAFQNSFADLTVRSLVGRCRKVNWPRLRKLSLRGLITTEGELCGILEQCRDTLEDMEFYQVYLKSGRWASVTMSILSVANWEKVYWSCVAPLQGFIWLDDGGNVRNADESDTSPRLGPHFFRSGAGGWKRTLVMPLDEGSGTEEAWSWEPIYSQGGWDDSMF